MSAYSVEQRLCFGQTAVVEKRNEIKAIRKQRADYVLAVKDNQEMLHNEVKTYLDDPLFEPQLKATE